MDVIAVIQLISFTRSQSDKKNYSPAVHRFTKTYGVNYQTRFERTVHFRYIVGKSDFHLSLSNL